jgi:hypothetical protein
MDQIDPTLVTAVTSKLKLGKRRDGILASIAVLNASLAQGGWTPRGAQSAQKGFTNGLLQVGRLPHENSYGGEYYEASHALSFVLRFGSANYGLTVESTRVYLALYEVRALMREKKISTELVLAWVALVLAVTDARAELDEGRPVPVVTAIGLSRKVTMTLQECALDIALPTIKPAKISFYLEPWYDDQGVRKLDRKGQPAFERIYYVDWSEGVQHGRSRFKQGCQACGKRIPSGRYVPIEATCRTQGLISLWLGCDCARNIFGVKDVGISRDAKPPV